MYDWNDLRYFLELSRQGKLVRAAARLHVDHTTVSRRITALEKQLDVRLFDKSPSGYQLTDAGLRLLPLAEQIESASHRLYQDIAGKDARLGGTVRVAAPEALGTQVLARHVAELRREHPDIGLELIAETRRLSLSKREADIAISLSRPDSGRLVAWKLCDYRLRLYATRDYLEAHAPIESTEDLAAHDFVSYIDDLIEMPEPMSAPSSTRFSMASVSGWCTASWPSASRACRSCCRRRCPSSAVTGCWCTKTCGTSRASTRFAIS